MAEIALQLGGGALSAFLQVLFDKLSSPVLRHFGFLFKVDEKLKSLEWTLSKIHTLVTHAETLHIQHDPGLHIWLRELKSVACDAEDVLDDFAAQSQSHYDIGKKIDEIQSRLSTIANERRDLGNAYPPTQILGQVTESKATSSLPERQVFGRRDERDHLVRLLLGRDESDGSAFSIVPIVGMGGLGKTTLARLVYNDPIVERHFSFKVWVCVSDDLNVRWITQQIVEAASPDKPCGCPFSSWDKLQNHLRWKLSNKKFLIVLDDAWCENRHQWERLLAPLVFGNDGSKVLITTRCQRVADIIGTGDSLLLDRLAESNCWDLFKACAFVNGDSGKHPRLEAIGRRIVRRLKGIPLAVKTIGGLLQSNLNEGFWTTVWDSELWKLPQYESDIMPVLRLSYQRMPAHLKLCFTFCSIFPKGFVFDKNRLVLLWIAQGFVQTHGRRRIEDIGFDYFDDLVCRSFFQKVGHNFLMHDLMHDLARSISADESMIIDGEMRRIPEKLLHASLHLCTSFNFNDLYKLKSLRTLVYLERSPGFGFSNIPKELFQCLKYLRILDLKRSNIVELPDSIGLLKHLRYLDLSYSKIRSLPKAIGDLCNLQTMRLLNCDIDVLPECVNKMINLRNFEGNSSLLSKLAGIGDLKSLQELDKFEVSRETRRNVGELKDLVELRGRLHISQLENVQTSDEAKDASLANKQYLRMLELEWSGNRRADGPDKEVLEYLKPHPNLKTLKIMCNDGVDFPSWLADQHLLDLEKISIVKCRRWKVLPPLGQLRSLKYLEIGSMAGVEKLGHEFSGDHGFPSLEVLRIYNMNEWDECVGLHGRKLFPSLRSLDISSCPKLGVLPSLPPTLELLKISHLGLSSLPRLWECHENSSSSSTSSSSSSSLSSSSSSRLSFLSISSCPELTSLEEGLLQQLHCDLKNLEISNCGNLVKLPTSGLRTLMVSLKSLTIDNCPNLTSLPIERSLPSSLETLKVVKDLHFISSQQSLLDQFQNLCSLSSLSISTSPNLTSLSGEVLRNLTALEKLTITGCKELSVLGIQTLNSLKLLTVTNCPNIVSLTDPKTGLQNFIPLGSITIRDCPNFASLPEELRCLSSLVELSIESCHQLHLLPELPGSLQVMLIKNCPQLARTYQRGSSDWQRIAHIGNIQIVD